MKTIILVMLAVAVVAAGQMDQSCPMTNKMYELIPWMLLAPEYTERTYQTNNRTYKIKFQYDAKHCMTPLTYPAGQPHYDATITVYDLTDGAEAKVGESFSGQYTPQGCFEDESSMLVAKALGKNKSNEFVTLKQNKESIVNVKTPPAWQSNILNEFTWKSNAQTRFTWKSPTNDSGYYVIPKTITVTNTTKEYLSIGAKPAPCPEGRIGCLVYHYNPIYSKTDYREIETVIRRKELHVYVPELKTNKVVVIEEKKLSKRQRLVKEEKTMVTNEWLDVKENEYIWTTITNVTTNINLIWGAK